LINAWPCAGGSGQPVVEVDPLGGDAGLGEALAWGVRSCSSCHGSTVLDFSSAHVRGDLLISSSSTRPSLVRAAIVQPVLTDANECPTGVQGVVCRS
jgi:hypothetical protein